MPGLEVYNYMKSLDRFRLFSLERQSSREPIAVNTIVRGFHKIYMQYLFFPQGGNVQHQLLGVRGNIYGRCTGRSFLKH